MERHFDGVLKRAVEIAEGFLSVANSNRTPVPPSTQETVYLSQAVIYLMTERSKLERSPVPNDDAIDGPMLTAENSEHTPRGIKIADKPANQRQVGGSHYGLKEFQHWDVVAMFQLDYFQGQITKYVMRWREKNGLQDLDKAAHFLQKYIEIERTRNG